MLFRGKLIIALMLTTGLLGCQTDDSGNPLAGGSQITPSVEISYTVSSANYINNRFFFLDLPHTEPHGRQPGETILLSSLKIFKHMGPGPLEVADVRNVAAYVDSNGFRDWDNIDFDNPLVWGTRWRSLTDFTPMLDIDGQLEAIDFGKSMFFEDVLAITYTVVDSHGNFIAQVGDDPSQTIRSQILPGDDNPYFRMKLLKAAANVTTDHLFKLVRRNIYSLGGQSIDHESFRLKILSHDTAGGSEFTSEGLPWIRLFGLDRYSPDRSPVPDGLADTHDPELFALTRGLLIFPLDNPYPFAADPEQYLEYVTPEEFTWGGSYLADNLAEEIYSRYTWPPDYPRYGYFSITTTYLRYDVSASALDAIPLIRTAWTWASAPVAWSDPDYAAQIPDSREFTPQNRVKNVRWFLPRDRTLRHYLNPDLVGAARLETQPTMDLYLRTDGSPWQPENWGGIMMSAGPYGADITDYSSLEIWLNDRQPDPALRSGKLHIDFGYISEDGFWPNLEGELETGSHQKEDTNNDGVWTQSEDVGLGARYGEQTPPYSADYEVEGDIPYPFINATARNNREDDENLNGSLRLDLENGYYTNTIDLAQTTPIIDVVNDYEDVQQLVHDRLAWRLYRINLADSFPININVEPNLARITHFRIWYENEGLLAPEETTIQFAGLKFLH